MREPLPFASGGYAVLRYIKGLTEPLTRVVRKYDIKVSNKSVRTLQQDFPLKKQTNVVYKISCKGCSWSYVGETGRCFETRKNEHIRNVKQNTANSNIAKHSWANDHTINFEDGQVIGVFAWLCIVPQSQGNSSLLPNNRKRCENITVCT